MKIAVGGGSGRLGARLHEQGHEALVAAAGAGVDAVTGEGRQDAMRGREGVIGVTDPPSLRNQAAPTLFDRSGRNLLAAGRQAGARAAHFEEWLERRLRRARG